MIDWQAFVYWDDYGIDDSCASGLDYGNVFGDAYARFGYTATIYRIIAYLDTWICMYEHHPWYDKPCSLKRVA